MDIAERSAWGAGGSDLRRELRVLWVHRWLIVLTTFLVVGLAVAYIFLATPIYTATATVLIRPTGIDLSTINGGNISNLISPETESAVATSQQVASIAQDALTANATTNPLFADATTESLLKHLAVSVPVGSEILQVSYSDPSRAKAAAGAQQFASAYLTFRQQQARNDLADQTTALEKQKAALVTDIAKQRTIIENASPVSSEYKNALAQKNQDNSQLTVLAVTQTNLLNINTQPGSVVSDAALPTAPSSPNKKLDIALGLFAGVFLGVGLAFLKNRTDNRLHERQQLEVALGAPVLSMVPRIEGWRNRDEAKLITISDPLSPSAEAYRVLRPVLLAAASKRGVKTVMVLSPMAGEGKSTTAANLAVVLAQSGRSVALVSTDLRRPRAHAFFDVAGEPGICEFLAGNATLAEIERRCSKAVGGDLVVFPSGRLVAHPAELLQSRQMQRFLEDQREAFDFVILDCPPVLAVSDALPLIPLSDGILFVADAESTTREQVGLARDRLLQMGGNILGAVINGLSSTSSSYYDDRYAYAYTSLNGDATNGSKRSRRVAKRSGSNR